jgi:hypothetical protein
MKLYTVLVTFTHPDTKTYTSHVTYGLFKSRIKAQKHYQVLKTLYAGIKPWWSAKIIPLHTTPE